MKVKVKTKLVQENLEHEYETFGILNKNQLQFIEEKTKVKLDFLKLSMSRDDPDKKILYKFRENEETLNELFLHRENISFMIPILTKRFRITDNFCDILYHLSDENKDVCYQISWEVVR